jgi:hypothetical protein
VLELLSLSTTAILLGAGCITYSPELILIPELEYHYPTNKLDILPNI